MCIHYGKNEFKVNLKYKGDEHNKVFKTKEEMDAWVKTIIGK